MTPYEVFFIIFAVAFALEEYTASQEHGWNSESHCFWESDDVGTYNVTKYSIPCQRWFSSPNEGNPLTFDL